MDNVIDKVQYAKASGGKTISLNGREVTLLPTFGVAKIIQADCGLHSFEQMLMAMQLRKADVTSVAIVEMAKAGGSEVSHDEIDALGVADYFPLTEVVLELFNQVEKYMPELDENAPEEESESDGKK